jgi:hypothetical protein
VIEEHTAIAEFLTWSDKVTCDEYAAAPSIEP